MEVRPSSSLKSSSHCLESGTCGDAEPSSEWDSTAIGTVDDGGMHSGHTPNGKTRTETCTSGSQSDATPAKSIAKPRLWALDNSKFFLTMLVVGGHTLMPGERWVSSLYHPATMTFMMPTYILISGYTSATDLSSVRKVDGILKVAAIYLLAQFLYLFLIRYFEHWLRHTAFVFGWTILYTVEKGHCESCWKYQDFLVPYWLLWYLQYLLVWRFLIVFWWRLKWPLVTAWIWGAVFSCFKVFRIMSDSIEYTWSFDMESCLAAFPLFVLGAVAKERRWQLWEHRWSRPAGIAVVLAFVWLPAAQTSLRAGEVTLRSIQPDTFDAFQGETWHWGGQMDSWNFIVGDGVGGRFLKTFIRMGVTLIQACSAWGVLHVMPRGEWPVMTSFGSRSLANYLFHPFSGLLFGYMGCYGQKGHPETAPWWGDIVVVVMIVPTSLFWMSPLVWKVVRPIVDPPIHLLLRPQDA